LTPHEPGDYPDNPSFQVSFNHLFTEPAKGYLSEDFFILSR